MWMLANDLPPEASAPGTWLHDALEVRDRWESRLLRSAAGRRCTERRRDVDASEGRADGAFDLARPSSTSGCGSSATPLPDFTWTPEYLRTLRGDRFAADGDEGRLVCVMPQEATWDAWERHPAGEEVVFLLSGRDRPGAGARRGSSTSSSCTPARPWSTRPTCGTRPASTSRGWRSSSPRAAGTEHRPLRLGERSAVR